MNAVRKAKELETMDVGTAALLFSLTARPVTIREHVLVRHSLVETLETSLPEGILPTRIFDDSTGAVTVDNPAADAVRDSGRLLQALRELPISEEDDAFVNDLVNRRTTGRKSRAL